MNIIELTPAKFKCGPFNCPAVFDLGNDVIAVIGKKTLPTEAAAQLSQKVGDDEEIVIIDRAMLEKVAPHRASN